MAKFNGEGHELTLKLALQNVTLTCSSMADLFEYLVNNKNTMQDVSNEVQKKSELDDAIPDSMAHTKIILGDIFSQGRSKMSE